MIRSSSCQLDHTAGLPLLSWSLFAEHELDAVVTTRSGGVSEGPYATLNLGLHVGDSQAAVLENRRRAAAALGLGLADLVFCNQAHGAQVRVVDDRDRGRGALNLHDAVNQTDALITTTPSLGLVVMVADCVPMVVYDPTKKILACVHAGWRGTIARVAEATVHAMCQLGSSAAQLLAALGPAIRAADYQVGQDVAEAAEAAFGLRAASGFLKPDGSGAWTFDLWAANRQQLIEAGVERLNIAMAPFGTDDSMFFSDRAVRPCGRFAAIATIK